MYLLNIALVLLSLITFSSCQTVDSNVHYLEAGDVKSYQPESRRRGFFESDIQIYCFSGHNKSLARAFQTVELQLDIDSDDFTQYDGPSPEIVRAHHDEQKSIFSLNLFSNKKTRLKLNPFNQTCIGIETLQKYRVRLHLIRVDFWKVILLAVGLFIFSFATRLSKNAIFYYISGILLGIFASFLIIIWLAGKLFPKRPMMYGVLIGGWTIGIYLIQMLWENFQMIILTYQTYVFWYIVVTGFVSFIICYRFGPPKNERSKNLIKWSLQLAALIMIFFSSQFEEAAMALILLTFLVHYFPRQWIRQLRALYIRKFPPRPRLLTEQEFIDQGVKETEKALAELREFCSSPDCKQWKLMTKLQDPIRFASFIEGSSHVMDDEVLEYETTRQDYTDSELSEEEDDQDKENEQAEEISEDEDNGVVNSFSQRNGSTPHLTIRRRVTSAANRSRINHYNEFSD